MAWPPILLSDQGYEKQRRCNRRNAVDADEARTRRPRKHEHIKKGHELLWPKQSRYPKGQTQLHKKAHLQLIHEMIPSENDIVIHRDGLNEDQIGDQLPPEVCRLGLQCSPNHDE